MIKILKAIKNIIPRPFTVNYYRGLGTYAPDYDRFIKNVYDNPFFRAPIQEIVRCFNNANIGVYRKVKKGKKVTYEKVEESPINDLLAEPSTELTQEQYHEYFLVWLLLGGGVLQYQTENIMVENKELFLYRVDNVQFRRNESTLQVDKIKIGKTDITGTRLKYYKIARLPNMNDKIAGKGLEFESPLKALMLQGDMVNFAFKHGNNQLKNQGRRGGILQATRFLNDKKKEEAKNKFKSQGGYRNAGDITMLEGENIKYIPTDMTPTELDWLNSMMFLREIIASTIGVPIQVMSTQGDTYNNVKEFKKKLYSDTVNPSLKFYCKFQTKALKNILKDDEFIWYDTSHVPELQNDVSDTIQKLFAAYEGKVTLNEFRTIITQETGQQLKPLKKEIGDRILVSSAKTFIEDLLIPLEPDPVPQQE